MKDLVPMDLLKQLTPDEWKKVNELNSNLYHLLKLDSVF